METKPITIPVSESIGAVSGIILEPDRIKAMLVLAHGAGAGMSHHFMELLAIKLAERSIGSLRFNFPFTENGKKRPDPPPIAEKTIAAVLGTAKEMYSQVPIFAAGKSFGGRMSSHYLSKTCPPFVRGIVFYGFPLHAAGAPSVARAEHLSAVKIPMLFLQGTRDALAELSLIKQVCNKLPSAILVTFEGADHSFKIGKREIISDLVEATETWMNSL